MNEADRARVYAGVAERGIESRTMMGVEIAAHASLAACWASLALVEELGRFHAVAVETSDT